MDFTEATIYTTTGGVDRISGLLTELGVGGLVIEDPADFQEFLEGTELYWDYVDESLMHLKEGETKIKLYLPVNRQGEEQLCAVRELLAREKQQDAAGELGSLRVELSSVREEDWANNWKQYFKPFPVGNRLAVKPSWEEYDNCENRVVVEIDPASSFGTGQHYTTRLCLELLENAVRGGERVLDMGCGSGILSAAALLLGAESAVGVDIDQNAVKTAEENLQKNGLQGRFEGIWGNAAQNPTLRERLTGFDLVLANIVADVILSLTPYFPQMLRPGGKLLVSGIIENRLEEVRAALEEAFVIRESRTDHDWHALLCEKK